MKKHLLLSSIFLVKTFLAASHADTHQSLIVEIASIDALVISASPAPFRLTPVVAGEPRTEWIDNSTTFAVSTNNINRSIYASLAEELPPGITLSVNFAATTGGTTLGAVPMNTAENRLLRGISKIAQASLPITYTMTSDATLNPMSSVNTIIYTIGP